MVSALAIQTPSFSPVLVGLARWEKRNRFLWAAPNRIINRILYYIEQMWHGEGGVSPGAGADAESGYPGGYQPAQGAFCDHFTLGRHFISSNSSPGGSVSPCGELVPKDPFSLWGAMSLPGLEERPGQADPAALGAFGAVEGFLGAEGALGSRLRRFPRRLAGVNILKQNFSLSCSPRLAVS